MCHRLFIPVVFFALCGVSAGQEDVPTLIHKLKDRDKEVRFNAAYAVGKIGPAAKEAVPALIAALKDEYRWVAASALGKIGPAAVPALIAALKDEDGSVRVSAAFALGWIGPAAFPSLIAALKD